MKITSVLLAHRVKNIDLSTRAEAKRNINGMETENISGSFVTRQPK